MRGKGPRCGPRSTETRASPGRVALTPDAIPARMAAADVYVLPSVREPHPMSVLEAMSVGLPVVVTNDCGLAPVGRAVAERNRHRPRSAGVGQPRLTPFSPIALAPRSMGERGRQTVHTHFGMRAIGDRLLDTYAEVAEGRR